MTWEVEGIRQRGRPKKTWWDCVKNDMEGLGSSKGMHSPGINGEGELWERERERERERDRTLFTTEI